MKTILLFILGCIFMVLDNIQIYILDTVKDKLINWMEKLDLNANT